MKKQLVLALLCSIVFLTNAFASERASKRILIAVTNNSVLGTSATPTGIHLSELTHPYFAFQAAGYDVDLVSPKGGNSPIDPTSVNDEDPANARFMNDAAHRARLNQTLAAGTLSANDYAAIFFVGGHGSMWDFPNSAGLSALAAGIYEKGGIVAAICHGPSGLLNIRLGDGSFLVTGKTVTSLTNREEEIGGRSSLMPFLLETELIARGAAFSKADPWRSHVVASGRLLTAQNPQSVSELSRKVIELLRHLN